jgi:hypothetical protein
MQKGLSTEELVGELATLGDRIQSLQEPTRLEAAASAKDNSVKYLLAEFNHLDTFWRHTDSRVENGLRLYLTVSTVVVSAMTILSQQVKDLHAFVLAAVVVAAALFAVGFALASHLLSTAFLKAEYIFGLNLIRRYFVDNDQSLGEYLAFPYNPSTAAWRDKERRIPAARSLLLGIAAWEGILLGGIFAGITWLVEPRFFPVLSIGGGVVIAAVCFAAMAFWARQRIRRWKEQEPDH